MVGKKFLALAILIALLLPLVLAVPGIPHQLYGDVLIDNQEAPNGITISAKAEGDTYSTTTSNGKYGYEPVFLVEDEAGNKAGETIEVYLNNIKVDEITFMNGEITQLDIDINGTCGDGVCSNYESCSSCSQDCGSCPSQPTGGGGGGGGGGSSGGGGGGGGSSPVNIPVTSQSGEVTNACVENWECSEWSDVSDACGERTCTDAKNCGTTLLKPDEKRRCKFKGLSSFLTGAVIGVVGSPLGIGVLIFILAIVAVSIYAFIMRKRAEK